MLSHCLECKKKTENKNPMAGETKNRKTMALSNCEICNIKTSRIIKEWEASVLSSSWGIKTVINP